MSIFLSLLSKLFPLYATMGAGAALSRVAGNLTAGLATLQIYLVAPVIVFANMLKLQFVPELSLLPVLFLAIGTLISVATHFVSGRLGSSYAPVLSQASGTANIGYLGVPIATILFPPDWMPVYFFTMLGGFVYESTLGYYWIARGAFSPREAIKSLLKLPILYALVAGLILNKFQFQLPEMWNGIVRDFMGAYAVLGALIVGFALANNKHLRVNPGFLAALLGLKWIVWPGLVWGALSLLRLTSWAVPEAGEKVLLLMSFMPMAANSAAFAAILGLHPEETATAVVLSTLLSLFIVPFYVMLFGLA